VRAVTGAVQDGHPVPGQPGATAPQQRLVGLDHEQIVRLLAAEEELGRVGVRVQCVGGDHRAGQLQVGQQRGEPGDFARGAVNLALGEHGAGGVVHHGEQVDLPAVASDAPQRRAVDRDHPPWMRLAGTVPGSQPRADHGGQRRRVHAGEGPADGGLGRHHPPIGSITTSASAARTGCGVSAAHSAIAVIDRAPVKTAAAAMARDRDQRMAAATGPSRVTDRGEVGEQTRRFRWSQRVGVGEVGEGGWDRG
jgi:hypothetical protein